MQAHLSGGRMYQHGGAAAWRRVSELEGVSASRIAVERSLTPRRLSPGEFEIGPGRIFLPRFQDGRREGRLIRGIRIVLGLETERGTIAVGLAAFERVGTVQEIPAIELDPGLVGIDSQDDTAEIAGGDGGRCALPIAGWRPNFCHVKHEIVVVTMPEFDLLVRAVVD